MRISDHGGSYGGKVNNPVPVNEALGLYNTVAIPGSVAVSGLASSSILLEPGLILSLSESYSGTSYTAQFHDSKGRITHALSVTFTTTVAGSWVFSNACKLPDGRYVFSHYGDLYTVSADLQSITKKSSAFTGDPLASIFILYMSKEGQLISVNTDFRSYIIDPVTLNLIAKPPRSVIIPPTSDSFMHRTQMEFDDYWCTKQGALSGPIIKVSKSVNASTSPVMTVTNTHNAWFTIVADGTIFSLLTGTVVEINPDTLNNIRSYQMPSSGYDRGMYHDRLRKKLVIRGGGSGTVVELDLPTRTFPANQGSKNDQSGTDQFYLYGVADPKFYRFLLRGRFYYWGLKKE